MMHTDSIVSSLEFLGHEAPGSYVMVRASPTSCIKLPVNVGAALFGHFVTPMLSIKRLCIGPHVRTQANWKHTWRWFAGVWTSATSDSDTSDPHKSEVEPAYLAISALFPRESPPFLHCLCFDRRCNPPQFPSVS